MACKWSAPFYEYYSHNIHSNIHAIARWAIEPHGVYDPSSGVTSNQAEGLNYVLKQLRELHENPVDCMVLALHYLQEYYLVEISRGNQGLGNYHLHSKFHHWCKWNHHYFRAEHIFTRGNSRTHQGCPTHFATPTCCCELTREQPTYQPTDPIGTSKMCN